MYKTICARKIGNSGCFGYLKTNLSGGIWYFFSSASVKFRKSSSPKDCPETLILNKGSVAKKRVDALLKWQEYTAMSAFKWWHYQRSVIRGCIRWYCKYGISYLELEEMMLERGFEVDYTAHSALALGST